jgi:hypothetical protein
MVTKKFEVVEALINDETKETRVIIYHKGLFWVVKTYDPALPKFVSIKIFHDQNCYQKTRSFWKTTSPLIMNRGKHISRAIALMNHYIQLIRR